MAEREEDQFEAVLPTIRPLDGLNLWQRLKLYFELSKAKWMVRRYFVINAFDGALAMLGIIVGSLSAGVTDPRNIIGIGVSAAVAMGISGAAGAYMSEKAERTRELKGLERAMMRGLGRTTLGMALRTAPVFIAIVDALAPLVMAFVTLIPFALAVFRLFPAQYLLQTTIALTLVELFMLGLFMGRVSKENVFVSGIKTLAIGVVTAAVVLLMGAKGF